MRRSLKLSAWALCLGLFTAACTNTKLVATWSNPELTAEPTKHVLVVAITDRADYQITFEQAIQTQLQRKNVEAKIGFEFLGADHKPSEDELRKSVDRMKEEGVETIIVITLLDVNESTRYVPGNTYAPYGYYGGWGPYYYSSYYTVREPGYYTTTTDIFLECRMYDLAQKGLIWAGQSETTDPSSADDFSKEYAAVIVEEIDRLGYLDKTKNK
jgi:hypothetical protein